MIRLCTIFYIVILALMGWQVEPLLAVEAPAQARLAEANADAIAQDEAAIAAHIKALHEEDSQVRETAAAALRVIVAKYPSGTSNIRDKDGGEAYWQEKVNQVQPGMTKAEVIKILPPLADAPETTSLGSGTSHIAIYRLDYHWRVTVQYRNPDKVIERPKLSKRQLLIHVAPPPNYTGTWTSWYVNGQKGQQTQYQDGKYHGVLTHYHDNGQRAYEQHYVNFVADGPDTGWYSDGKKMYVAQYRNGKQDGQWLHWYPNGNKQREAHYKEGVLDGLEAGWYENGQQQYEMNYKNGILHGIEAAWNQQGVLQFKRERKDGEVVG